MEDRIREILNELDVDFYCKQIHFPQEVNEELLFYSRDECRNISFKELLREYIPRLGDFETDVECGECMGDCVSCEHVEESAKVMNKHCELFSELIDYYSLYRLKNLMSKDINGLK